MILDRPTSTGGEAGVEFLATSWLTGFANYSLSGDRPVLFSGTATREEPPLQVQRGIAGEWDNGWSGDAALYHVGAAT